MKKPKTLRDALLDELKDLYSAENQLLKALPKMIKKASNSKLKEAISAHLEETEAQVDRLDKISIILKEKLSGKTCKAMQGLIEEGKEVLEEESENEAFIDALLIGAAQRVEHYEMAAYGTARAMADELEEEEVANLLGITLEEESAADEKLSSISIDEVLPQANEFADERATEKQMASNTKESKRGSSHVAHSIVLALLLAGGLLTSNISYAETRQGQLNNEKQSAAHDVDNSGRNARDVNDYRKTADEQSLAGKETEVLAKIRREIVANDNLSVNGKNVKVIVDKGVVTLRGPVKSEQEKEWIEKATERVATTYKVNNQLEIAPS